jgi:putative endonuclease
LSYLATLISSKQHSFWPNLQVRARNEARARRRERRKLPGVTHAQDPRHIRGKSAERLAERHLIAMGLRIIARNFRCRAGELDLICLDADVLVVVEVRQRKRNGLAGPLESVGESKRRRIRRATEFFRLGCPPWRRCPVRFDVVAVHGAPDAIHEIEWVKAAFT